MDMEFEKLADITDKVLVNTTEAHEHVGDVERYTRVIKEWGRSIASELPYKYCMPDEIIIHLIEFVTMWINAIPSDLGVLLQFNPWEIISGLKMDVLAFMLRQAKTWISQTLSMTGHRSASLYDPLGISKVDCMFSPQDQDGCYCQLDQDVKKTLGIPVRSKNWNTYITQYSRCGTPTKNYFSLSSINSNTPSLILQLP